MAVIDLSITRARQQVVDFTIPFMYTGKNIFSFTHHITLLNLFLSRHWHLVQEEGEQAPKSVLLHAAAII